MKKTSTFLVSLLLFFFSLFAVQTAFSQQMKVYNGNAGITKKISELKPAASKKTLDSTAVKPIKSYFKKYQSRFAPRGTSTGINIPKQDGNDNKLASANSVTSPDASASVFEDEHSGLHQQIRSNFLAIDFYKNPIGWPPDPSGAVSNTQIIVSTNNGIAVFDKPGVTEAPILTPTGYSGTLANAKLFLPLEKLFSPVLPDTSGISDPHIRYDRLTKRWFIVSIEVNPSQENNAIFLAVSNGETITDSSSFTYYSFNSSLFPYDLTAPYAPFLDYPTLGVDENSVVIGGNQFGYDSLTNVGYVINKKKLLHGELVVAPFELGVANFITGAVGGMYTPQGVYNDEPGSKKSFFAGITYFQDGLVIASLKYDAAKRPYLERETTLPVGPFNNARDNSSPGGLVPIDQLDTRLFAAAIYKNKLTGKSSLWTAHAIGVDKSGNFIGGTDSDYVAQARTGSRWYEIGDIYTKPVVSQLGTLHDASQPSGRRAVQYFNPSIAANGQGRAVMGGTTDAFNEYLNVFVSERYFDDESGSMRKPVKATHTTAIYAPYVSFFGSYFYIGRWGDFSQTVTDPADDQTMWAFQQYADVDDSYGVRVVQVAAPAPAVPLPLGGALCNSADTTLVLEGFSIGNRGFFDPGKDKGGPGYKRLRIKSSGDISVGNIKFISSTEISFKLNIKNKPSGDYILTITNPDGQSIKTVYTIGTGSEDKTANKSLAALNSKKENIAGGYITTSAVSPNPAVSEVKLSVTAAKNFGGKILLLDANGTIIRTTSYQFISGYNNISLPLTGLSNGTYIATVYNQANVPVAVQKIIKE